MQQVDPYIYLVDVLQRLLRICSIDRQVEYNPTHVLNDEMEIMGSVQWAPNMCRDGEGVIYNSPHAMAGVGDMFRSPLKFGGRFSQFRNLRELDGTMDLSELPRFQSCIKLLNDLFQEK